MRYVGYAALGLIGFVVIAILSGRSPDAVSEKCRDTVALAAANVDAWRYIQSQCTEQEQQALIREFQRRGLSTADIERSRAERLAAR
ncbi:hypothetical protein NI456_03520 [Brevundimonas diminuta]|uniref:hypothetical protein n=1 Tax=Brevundimonas diminuta TaxID=293 RepID=UPI002097CF1E|nr:hypothetical protein [Brevundimonas diminuta]MCO8017922.1 hypothetical protein [Brevundimonas diminuta]MCO8021442.1 hypothetical protein [Brevundimonas diminuta]